MQVQILKGTDVRPDLAQLQVLQHVLRSIGHLASPLIGEHPNGAALLGFGFILYKLHDTHVLIYCKEAAPCSNAPPLFVLYSLLIVFSFPKMSTPALLPTGVGQNRGPQLMAMFWIETIVAIAVVALRFYARISIRGVGADDWMMLFTVVSVDRTLTQSYT
jgi:hypothetical protein